MSFSSVVRSGRWIAAAAGLVIVAPSVSAQSVQSAANESRTAIEVRAGATRSDNVRRTPTDEVDGTIWSAGLGLDVSRHGPRLNLVARGDLDWMEFPSDTFDSDVFGHLNALATLAIVPEVFVWSFEETYGQLRADPLAAVTPDNLEDIQYFTTGPDITFRFGSVTSLRLSGRYSTTTSGVDQLDSDRYRGDLALIRALSAASELSLQLSNESFKFSNAPPAADFERREAFARYAIRGARTDLSVDLGYTVIDQQQDTSDGILARLSLARRLSSASRLQLSLGTQFSSAGDLFRYSLEQQTAAVQAGTVLATNDPFENRSAAASWDFNRNRTAFGVNAERSEELHENFVSLDRTRTAYGVYFERRLSAVLRLRADAQRSEYSYDAGFDDEELQAGVALAWSVGRTLELSLRYERMDRDSSIAATDYTENRLLLFATWAPLARR